MKKFNIKKLATSLLAVTLTVASLAGCGKEAASTSASNTETGKETSTEAKSDAVYRTLDEIKASGKINIGVFSDKNPFGYVDENGKYQ